MNFHAAVAMEIAGVNLFRFNEAVANGFYKCAPATEHRKSRRFGTADMIGLCVFGRLRNAEFSYRVAGEIACTVVELVQTHGDALEAVTFAWKADGQRQVGPWFGKGNEKGRPVLDPDAAGYAVKLHLDITEIGKYVSQQYYQLHQSGDLKKLVSDDAE